MKKSKTVLLFILAIIFISGCVTLPAYRAAGTFPWGARFQDVRKKLPSSVKVENGMLVYRNKMDVKTQRTGFKQASLTESHFYSFKDDRLNRVQIAVYNNFSAGSSYQNAVVDYWENVYSSIKKDYGKPDEEKRSGIGNRAIWKPDTKRARNPEISVSHTLKAIGPIRNSMTEYIYSNNDDR